MLHVQDRATIDAQKKVCKARAVDFQKVLGERANALLPILDALQHAQEAVAKAKEEFGKWKDIRERERERERGREGGEKERRERTPSTRSDQS